MQRTIMYVDEKNMSEWRKICREYCKKIGAELVFVNDYSFGYERKGQLVHLYVDELAELLS